MPTQMSGAMPAPTNANMKTLPPTPAWLARMGGRTATILIAVLCTTGLATAQGFDVGSTGEQGDLVINANTTLDLPPDGRIHVRNLTVNAGVTLQFRKNLRNTPVFILAQSNIVVNGVISVNGGNRGTLTGGIGGPGGFDGGKPGFGSEFAPGHGYGPGAGRAGVNSCNDAIGVAAGGSFGNLGFGSTNGVYGDSLLLTLIGGSGGGGGAGSSLEGGGGGGGAILLAANNRITINGTVSALGGFGGACNNPGSGGAIRLVAFRVEGTGTLDCRSGPSAGRGPGSGDRGFGRIRVDTLERSGLTFGGLFGIFTAGSNLISIPPNVPTLETIEAAGNPVAQGGGPVVFVLPFNSSPNQSVRVQARDFGRRVPILVTLTPDSGTPIQVAAEINNETENPASTSIPFTLPTNTRVTVHAWTR